MIKLKFITKSSQFYQYRSIYVSYINLSLCLTNYTACYSDGSKRNICTYISCARLITRVPPSPELIRTNPAVAADTSAKSLVREASEISFIIVVNLYIHIYIYLSLLLLLLPLLTYSSAMSMYARARIANASLTLKVSSRVGVHK